MLGLDVGIRVRVMKPNNLLMKITFRNQDRKKEDKLNFNISFKGLDNSLVMTPNVNAHRLSKHANLKYYEFFLTGIDTQTG